MTTQTEAAAPFRCRFCGKSQAEVAKLIVASGVTATGERLSEIGICAECVELCMVVVASENADWRDKQIERLKGLANPPEDDQTSN